MALDNQNLTKDGKVRVSPVSLVAVADLRPITLGERVRRYMRTPKFLQDQNNLDGYDEEDFLLDPHENPLSPHEERSAEILENVRKRKMEEREAEKQRLIDEEKADREKFRKRLRELREEGDEPPLPLGDV